MTQQMHWDRSRRAPWRPPIWEILLVLALGILFVGISEWKDNANASALSEAMRTAFATMSAATGVLASYRNEHGPPIDPDADINATGWIGSFFSPMTTTVGNLEAKRTTTNPQFAALIVQLLTEAGARTGDLVAVGASGSFPALIAATMVAAEALDLRVAVIVSLGASQYGANQTELTWLDIEEILYSSGIVSTRSVAASLGGDQDVGRDLDEDVRRLLRDKIDASGTVFLDASDLESNVRQRMAIYQREAQGSRIAAFISVGGGSANLGSDASVLSVPPGLTDVGSLPPPSARGVLHAMAERGVPVIHLLNMKDLVRRHGLPWDPSPLPALTEWAPRGEGENRVALWCAGAYVTLIAGWFASIALRRRVRVQRRRPS